MTEQTLMLVWLIVTCTACGAWLGWFAGRRHEKSVQIARRIRKRRPLSVSIDFDFAVRAFNQAGYKVVPMQERLH